MYKKKIKPKVEIISKILIKYHTFGNNNLEKKLENEGAEVILPELKEFIKYSCINAIFKRDL